MALTSRGSVHIVTEGNQFGRNLLELAQTLRDGVACDTTQHRKTCKIVEVVMLIDHHSSKERTGLVLFLVHC